MKAIVVRQYGGPEVLRYEEVPDPEPKPGEVLLKVRVAGFNYADVMMRVGLYKGGPLPVSRYSSTPRVAGLGPRQSRSPSNWDSGSSRPPVPMRSSNG